MKNRLVNNIILILFPAASISLLAYLLQTTGNPLLMGEGKTETFVLFILCYALVLGAFLINFILRSARFHLIAAIIGLITGILFLLPRFLLKLIPPIQSMVMQNYAMTGFYALNLSLLYLIICLKRK
ncbi:MAG: hypothetical protein Q4P30_05555 [Eubacteriales bacterium]|nr:hypothetical protein [Eubacteriales bacterium]